MHPAEARCTSILFKHASADTRVAVVSRRLDCLEGGQQASLRHAQQLIHKLRCRDLYRYINEVMVPVAWLKDKRWDVSWPGMCIIT